MLTIGNCQRVVSITPCAKDESNKMRLFICLFVSMQDCAKVFILSHKSPIVAYIDPSLNTVIFRKLTFISHALTVVNSINIQ